MSVSFFKISCDFPDCEMALVHGPARPPLSVGAFQEAVGLLLVAHRWTVDEEGGDLCALHSQSSDRVQKKGTVIQHLPSTPDLLPRSQPVDTVVDPVRVPAPTVDPGSGGGVAPTGILE